MPASTLTDSAGDLLVSSLAAKVVATTRLLDHAARDFAPAAFPSTLSAEDQVLTDLICRSNLDIEIFTRETGRMAPATYELLVLTEARYGRRIEPVGRALESRKARITGLRRTGGGAEPVRPLAYDKDAELVSVNPLADWSEQEIWAYIRSHGVPCRRLDSRGQPGIG